MGTPGAMTAPDKPSGTAQSRLTRALRALSGAFAAALVLLLVVVLGGGVYAVVQDEPGPGVGVLIGHAVAAVSAVLLQLAADRRADAWAAAAAVAVITVGCLVVGAYWLY